MPGFLDAFRRCLSRRSRLSFLDFEFIENPLAPIAFANRTALSSPVAPRDFEVSMLPRAPFGAVSPCGDGLRFSWRGSGPVIKPGWISFARNPAATRVRTRIISRAAFPPFSPRGMQFGLIGGFSTLTLLAMSPGRCFHWPTRGYRRSLSNELPSFRTGRSFGVPNPDGFAYDLPVFSQRGFSPRRPRRATFQL